LGAPGPVRRGACGHPAVPLVVTTELGARHEARGNTSALHDEPIIEPFRSLSLK
jgi:hypothetical protein